MKLLLNILILILIVSYTYTNSTNQARTNKKTEKKKPKARNINMKKQIDPKVFRNNMMKALQKRHTYKMAVQEKMSDNFIGTRGLSNTKDAFINYLGFLRNSSLKANKKAFKKDSKKFLK